MKFTLSWLKQFLETDKSLVEITDTLTMIGLEVEGVDDRSHALKNFVVAQIIEVFPHPNADRLKICKVDTGTEIRQIVCGAPNARALIKVVLAKPDAIIPNGNYRIKDSKIRGVDSAGMLCSADELGINNDLDRILELESDAVIGTELATYFGYDDPVICVNITPNRADALSVHGIARDLAAAGVGRCKELIQQIETTDIKAIDLDDSSRKQITVDQQLCPLFVWHEIQEVDNSRSSPQWLRNLLNRVGVSARSPIVDIANYVMYSYGQPLHAYDSSMLTTKMNVQSVNSPRSFKALNGKEYVLQKNDILVCDDQEVHGIAGIIGSANSACSQETKSILLEAAVFRSGNIVSTGRRLGIDTAARYRFERHVDANVTEFALEIATALIIKYCGGKVVYKGKFDYVNKDNREIIFSAQDLTLKTGLVLDISEVGNILKKLGFRYAQDANNNLLRIIVPSWRNDISKPENIIEEIVRIHGYNNIPESVLPIAPMNHMLLEQRLMSEVKRVIASCGYHEVVSWSFMCKERAKKFGYAIDEQIEIKNPISQDLNYMRPTILANLLAMCSNNLNRSIDSIALFEVGPVFLAAEKTVNHACGVRVGYNMNPNPHAERRLYDVFDIKADLEMLLGYYDLDIAQLKLSNTSDNTSDTTSLNYYHPTRSWSLCYEHEYFRKAVATFGSLTKEILAEFQIDAEVMAFEIDINALQLILNTRTNATSSDNAEYVIVNYPVVSRDYAFIVDAQLRVGEIINYIRAIDKKLIKSVELFDIYSGDQIPSGKKSVAFCVNIQDNTKTMTEMDISQISDKIIKGVAQQFGAILR